MRRQETGLVALALAACVVPGCTTPGPLPERDSGVVRDAGRDAGRTARPDAAGDAGRDGGSDAPGWVPIPGMPADCAHIEVARNPENVLPPLEFTSCDPRFGPSCRQVVVDWRASGHLRFFVETGMYHEGHGYFLFVRDRLHVVARDDGAVVGALRQTGGSSLCFLDRADLGAGKLAYGLSRPPTGARPIIIGGEVADLASTMRVLLEVDPSFLGAAGGVVSRVRVGSEGVAYNTWPLGAVAMVRWNNENVAFTNPDRSEGEASVDEVIGDAVFYSTGPSSLPFHVRVASAGVAAQPLVPLYPDSGFESLWLATDGTDMAWFQYYEPVNSYTWARIELWTAPFEIDPGVLTPRRVARMPFEGPVNSVWVGGGHAVTAYDSLHVYRLADGALITEIPTSEAGGWRAGAIYMGPETMALAPELLDERGRGTGESRVLFVRYDELGP